MSYVGFGYLRLLDGSGWHLSKRVDLVDYANAVSSSEKHAFEIKPERGLDWLPMIRYCLYWQPSLSLFLHRSHSRRKALTQFVFHYARSFPSDPDHPFYIHNNQFTIPRNRREKTMMCPSATDYAIQILSLLTMYIVQ